MSDSLKRTASASSARAGRAAARPAWRGRPAHRPLRGTPSGSTSRTAPPRSRGRRAPSPAWPGCGPRRRSASVICGAKPRPSSRCRTAPRTRVLAVPIDGGQRDAREEGRARRADVGVGRDQLLLGRADVGPLAPAGRTAGRPAGRASAPAASSPCCRPRWPRAAPARPAAAPARSGPACAGAAAAHRRRARFRPATRRAGSRARTTRRCRSAACVSLSDSSRVASVWRVISQQLVVGEQREPAVGHRGDQADLRRLARFLGGQVLRQRRVLQAGDAAEEVDLPGRDAQARRCSVRAPRCCRASGGRWREPLAPRVHRREQRRARGSGTARAPARC